MTASLSPVAAGPIDPADSPPPAWFAACTWQARHGTARFFIRISDLSRALDYAGGDVDSLLYRRLAHGLGFHPLTRAEIADCFADLKARDRNACPSAELGWAILPDDLRSIFLPSHVES